LKLLLDEMYPRVIAAELRRRGHDATSVHDTPGGGASDDAVFDHARAEGRAIVTENIRDYRPLAQATHEAGETQSGLILTTAKHWPRQNPGALITALDELARPTQTRSTTRSTGCSRPRA
jgi:predicted nuclease of predicted toxin-antitoxin system